MARFLPRAQLSAEFTCMFVLRETIQRGLQQHKFLLGTHLKLFSEKHLKLQTRRGMSMNGNQSASWSMWESFSKASPCALRSCLLVTHWVYFPDAPCHSLHKATLTAQSQLSPLKSAMGPPLKVFSPPQTNHCTPFFPTEQWSVLESSCFQWARRRESQLKSFIKKSWDLLLQTHGR